MKRLVAATLTLVLAACGLALPASPALAAETPEQFVERTATDVLAVLRDASLDHDAKVARLETMLDQRSDFDTVTKLVLAANYRQFSDSQKSEFRQLFREYLSVTYSKQIDQYADERVIVVGGHPEIRDDYTVKTKLVRKKGADLVVDYRVRKKDGGWVLIDVIGEGISLIANLRSQFQEVLSRGGPEHLLKVLREKNASGGGDPLPTGSKDS